MPIYEYQSLASDNICPYCRNGFEIIQHIGEKPLSRCPDCKNPVKKIVSWCRSSVKLKPEESARIEKQIKDYERSEMWSHAAELADKHSEKVKDNNLKIRALENYQKAGYNADSLAKHAKLDEK